MKSIVVFCGSGTGEGMTYLDNSREVGHELANRRITLIYGGASIGCMGAVADGALEAGGRVIGIIPQFIEDHEIAHSGLTELITVESMHERKLKMYDLCDAALALPGGFGTMDELFEMLTWQQLALHRKPIALHNLSGYYDHLISLTEKMANEGLLRRSDQKRILHGENAFKLIDQLMEQADELHDRDISSKA